MAEAAPTQKEAPNRYKPAKIAILGMGLLFFMVFASIAFLLCYFHAQNVTQTILNQQKDLQQTTMENALDSIRKWRNELVEQARFVSSSELFRLFVSDAQNLTPREVARLHQEETLHSSDENLRTRAEQLQYMQNFIRDFTTRQGWLDARILLPNGNLLASAENSLPLSDAQHELAQKAASKSHYLFGSVRSENDRLVIDLADPLFDVLGSSQPKIVAVLLLTVSMNEAFTSFLALPEAENLLARIINAEDEHLFMILSRSGTIQIEPIADAELKIQNFPFARRPGLDGKTEVFSTGNILPSLDWLYLIESPASKIEEQIATRRWQIYSLGGIGSFMAALLCAWLWSVNRSRYYQTEAIKFQNLYTTINDQKMMLDSINSSFKAGLALVDNWGRIQMSNPAFSKICNLKDEIEKSTPLVKALPDKVALHLLEDVTNVREAQKIASDEVIISRYTADNQKEERLYRVTLYPYSEKSEDDTTINGCVLIFEDITEYRRKAIEEKERLAREQARQKALIRAFQRAIESVDPNLAGHSEKMAIIARLLAKELHFNKNEKETLDLAARLSQIGKIYVPRHLLSKKEELSPEERAEVQKAPEYAQRILEQFDFDLPVRETIGEIYERVDGSGKPEGLMGKDISLPGRALGVINAFIAMTSPRAWRNSEAMSIEDALRELKTNRGFDQGIVETLDNMPRDILSRIVNSNSDES